MTQAQPTVSAETPPPQPIIVGIDDSPASELAVDWAVAEARSRGTSITLIHGYVWNSGHRTVVAGDRYMLNGLREDAERLAERVRRRVHDLDASLDVSVDIAESYAPDLLAGRSTRASLIVVGSSHHGPAGRVILGSISSATSARSHVPVVVVCGPAPAPPEHRPVVAGVQLDRSAEAVMAFALDHAARHGVHVRAVLCVPRTGLSEPPGDEFARRWLSEAVTAWRRERADVGIEPVIARGAPARALVEHATGASLLVVGRHGRTPALGGLLGSVSQAVIHHATGPVAIVPVPDPGGDQRPPRAVLSTL